MRRNPNGAGRKGETAEAVAKRHADLAAKQRWARESLERARRVPTTEAQAIYRDEKAKWLERTAQARADEQARIRAAVAKADAGDLVVRRGGRPKGSKNRGPSIAVFGRSKLDLLRESRPGGTL